MGGYVQPRTPLAPEAPARAVPLYDYNLKLDLLATSSFGGMLQAAGASAPLPSSIHEHGGLVDMAEPDFTPPGYQRVTPGDVERYRLAEIKRAQKAGRATAALAKGALR